MRKQYYITDYHESGPRDIAGPFDTIGAANKRALAISVRVSTLACTAEAATADAEYATVLDHNQPGITSAHIGKEMFFHNWILELALPIIVVTGVVFFDHIMKIVQLLQSR
jgi:hypothetical protein